MYSASRLWYIPEILRMVCGHVESLCWVPSESRIILNFCPWGESVLAFHMISTHSRKSKPVLRFVWNFSSFKLEKSSFTTEEYAFPWKELKVHMNLIKAQTTIFCMTHFYFAIRNCIALTHVLIKHGEICSMSYNSGYHFRIYFDVVLIVTNIPC